MHYDKTLPLLLAPILISAIGMTAPEVAAAVLTNNTTAGSNVTSANLSTLGTTNWAAWDSISAGAASIAASTSKTSGLGTISAITPTSTATDAVVRGTESRANYVQNIFTWTTSGATGAGLPANGRLTGIFQSPLNIVDTGVKFSVGNLAPLPAGQYYLISVFATGYQAVNTLTASSGGTLVSQESSSFGNSKSTDVFRFNYEPTLGTEQIDFSYTIKTDTNSDQALSQAVIQAVTISVVPEPSSALLVVLGGFSLLRRRR